MRLDTMRHSLVKQKIMKSRGATQLCIVIYSGGATNHYAVMSDQMINAN